VLTGTKNQGQKRWYCQVKETKLAERDRDVARNNAPNLKITVDTDTSD